MYVLFPFSFCYKNPEASSGSYSVYGSRCQGNDETKGQREKFVTKLQIINLLLLHYFLLEFQNMVTDEGYLT